MGTELHSAVEIARLVASRAVRAVDVIQDALQRIESRNAELNAVVWVDKEDAIQRAEALDKALNGGEPPGPLCGVPFTVKDVIETRGIRTTAGSPLLASYVPERSAPAVDRLLRAGAILVGKTNTPAFSADIQCSSPLLGRANNPHNPERTTGGSSGGGAAAVAIGMSALELGSDHGGSIRIPAAFCGVVGLKATAGVVPSRGHLHPVAQRQLHGHRIICVGPIARNVADVEVALRVLTEGGGDDGAESPSWDQTPVDGTLRLAVIPHVDGLPISRHIQDALQHSVDALARAGHATEHTSFGTPHWQQAWQAWHLLISDDIQGPLGAAARAWWRTRSNDRMIDDALAAAEKVRTQTAHAWDALLADADAILTPATLTPAFPHCATNTPVDIDGTPTDYWLAAAATTCLPSLTGHPAIVLPVGVTSDGLPMSLQLVGRRGEDARLLKVARIVETVLR